jgi:hypothetical protein
MGAVDFDDAKGIVREHLLARWTWQNGTLKIADHGFRDATHWRVLAGTVPPPPGEEPPETPLRAEETAYLVDRSTGALEVLSVAGNEARLAQMRPWSSSEETPGLSWY